MKTMKALYLLLLSAFIILSGCSKVIKDQQDDIAVQAIVNGRWTVSLYQKDTVDMTSSFSGFEFQFRDNDKVEAIRNTTVEFTGDWSVSTANRTISANFGGVAEPISLLNGTWNISSTTWTTVEASQTVNGSSRTLHLVKL